MAEVDRTDPVTLNDIDMKKAYYLRSDVSNNGRIKAMYKKTTLDRVLRTDARSPLTRKPFFRTDIAQVPRMGRVHPDLLGKNMETVLSHDDTKMYTWNVLKKGQTATFLTNDDGATKLKVKKVEPASDGSRQYEVSIDATFHIKGGNRMDDLADGLASMFRANSKRILVVDTRVSSAK